ncbi:CDP-glycerol glycerophosphotransferase family protein [Latilactobacillus sakei]|uniref:CDP-glycerol glycerophosphotransferase family protein n=1 Tax=Latilactobacillus sakei TaxID=1599 RepID=UPI0020C76598|nr:CDP-glycerol glycerophosphotransferase family protein [Latilactobacillus sakei]MCP8856178.1 CDP-glycerol glycerophosphotransferase family protein [Latilactobacillus sakei]
MYVYPIFFYFTKVENKTFYFSSFGGQKYSDSPRIISDAVYKNMQSSTIIWQYRTNDVKKIIPNNYSAVYNYSLKSAYELSKAKFIIGNSIMDFVHKKNNQTYIQCWHGTPLKKIENDAKEKLSTRYIKRSNVNTSSTDLLLAGNKYSEEIFKSAFSKNVPIGRIGTPRVSDMLNRNDREHENEIREKMGVSEDVYTVCYAPTFRDIEDENGQYQLNLLKPEFLLKSIEKKVGKKCKLLIKFHPNITVNLGSNLNVDYIDVSKTFSMEDTLLVTDMLITDYSSSFFDYALLKRPILLFCYDKEKYRNMRGFYRELEDLPLYVANDSKELVEIINNVSMNQIVSKSLELEKYLENYEDGKTVENILEYINGLIKKETDECEKSSK